MDQLFQNRLSLLPQDLKKEMLDNKEKENTQQQKFSFDWEGGISELKKQYISVDLQHKGSEWR